MQDVRGEAPFLKLPLLPNPSPRNRRRTSVPQPVVSLDTYPQAIARTVQIAFAWLPHTLPLCCVGRVGFACAQNAP